MVFELSHIKLIFKTYFMWKKIMFKNTRIWQIISIYFFSWLCYHLLMSVRYPHLLTDLRFFPYDIFTYTYSKKKRRYIKGSYLWCLSLPLCLWVRLEPTGLTSVFGIKVQINKKVIRLVLPPSLSASLSLIHNVFVD